MGRSVCGVCVRKGQACEQESDAQDGFRRISRAARAKSGMTNLAQSAKSAHAGSGLREGLRDRFMTSQVRHWYRRCKSGSPAFCGANRSIIPQIVVKVNECAMLTGGEGGIRTPGTVARTRDFQSRTFDHSVTSPGVIRRLLEAVVVCRRGAEKRRASRGSTRNCAPPAFRGLPARPPAFATP